MLVPIPREIAPAIRKLVASGLTVTGPLPADTLFFRAQRGDFDLVVAMYHDQGHAPVKVMGFDTGVNVTVGLQVTREEPVQFAASLTGTRLAPDAAANVTLTKTDSGWKIELHATGLPRRGDGEFYQAWLKGDAGLLVPIGTFNEGTDVTLWSGVGQSAFPTLTITKEVADGNQASSGHVVLIGQANET